MNPSRPWLRFIEGTGDTTDQGGGTTTSTSESSTTTDSSAQSATTTGTDTTTSSDTGKTSEEIDWKAMARQWEKRAKDNTKAADELAKLKTAQMNDQQKAEAAATAATERADAAERRAALLQAAVDHNLSKADLELLEDVPADKIEARAKALAARLKASAPAGSSGSTDASGDKNPKKPTSLTGAIGAHYTK